MKNINMRRCRGYIQRDGFIFGYSIEGRGAPLLIVGSHEYYPRTFSHFLRRRRTLICVDHRGFAHASRPVTTQDCKMDVILEDIYAICKTLRLERLDVLGHSGHGYMALELAKRYPDLIKKVVLVATGPSHSADHIAAAQRRWDVLVAPERKQKLLHDLALMETRIEKEPKKRFVWMCRGLAARSWFEPSYDDAELWKNIEVNMLIFDKLWGEVFCRYDPKDALENLDVPIQICMGLHDYLVAPADTWFSCFPENKEPDFALFERSGHHPQLEEPELFDQVVLDFLDVSNKKADMHDI